ncbi:hypothetical protein PybrP1_003173 [[Pythium] brassicae (nom. inval.)]|nr:hypothetical protein PybrP1_003173 [[Pythium] brassicae (nom. inval.)]
MLNWLGRLERVQFACGELGDGCEGAITADTRVALAFARTGGRQALQPATPRFRLVHEYVRELSSELGGVDAYARTLLPAILARLEPAPSATAYSAATGAASDANVGAILSGLPGVGKTLLAKALCECLGVPTTFLHAADVFKTFVGQSEAQLVRAFERAAQQAPSILVVDGIEAVTAARGASADAQNALEVGVLGTFLACLERVKSSGQRVFVLGTTSHLDAMDSAVSSNGRLDLIVRMEPPGLRERLEILRALTATWTLDRDPEMPLLARLSDATGGFVGADLLSLCQKALQFCLAEATASTGGVSTAAASSSSAAVIRWRHFEKALAETYPSVLQAHHVSQRRKQSAGGSVQKTDASRVSETPQSAFAGVYGMDAAVRTLTVSLLEPLEDSNRFLAFGTVPPKGILLTGAPGSGKTHLANAVADEVRRRGLASFVSVNCTDLLTKIVGDTEKALRELFATARNAAPCVLYFDQIESIAPVRGFDTSTEQTFDRMLSMLLVEMDGFSTSPATMFKSVQGPEARSAFLKQHVVILASTTRKELLDPAILRPGRFDVHVHVNFPDEGAREQIALDALATIPLDYSQDPALSDPRAVAAYVAKHSSGKSAGDVRALLREAAIAALREQVEAGQFDGSNVPIKFVKQTLESGGDILGQHFGSALSKQQHRTTAAAQGGRRGSQMLPTSRDRRSRR